MTRKPGYQKRERIKSMKINAYMIASDVERMFMQIYQVSGILCIAYHFRT